MVFYCCQGIFLWESDREALKSRSFLHPLILHQQGVLTAAGTMMLNSQLLQWHTVKNPKAYLQFKHIENNTHFRIK